MIEKDDIQELFSKSLENHTTPVRPEVWSGLQAKMAAAGLTTAAGATAAKGMSLLTKWIIGGAAAVTTTVVTTLVVVNQTEPAKQNAPVKELTAETRSEVQTQEQQPAAGKQSGIITHTGPRVVEDNQGANDATNSSAGGAPIAERYFNPESSVVENRKDDNAESRGAVAGTEQRSSKTEDRQEQRTGRTETTEVAEAEKPLASIEQLVIPNGFTPNGDGYNDKYFLQQRGDVNPEGFSIRIFDGQFNAIVTSEDPNFEWDGLMKNGDPAPQGKYTCLVVGTYTNGKKINERGIFELIRR